MFFTSPTANITPAMTSVAMSRSDSRDSTGSTTQQASCAPTSAYSALVSASPTSTWPSSQRLVRSDSNTSTNTSLSSQPSSVAMRRDSSNSSWLPSPYRSCMSSFGTEPNSFLSDDDLLCPAEALSLPIETIPTVAPKRELTTEEQIAFLRELQEKEAAHQYPAAAPCARDEVKRKVVRFAAAQGASSASRSRRPSGASRRQSGARRSLTGPQ